MKYITFHDFNYYNFNIEFISYLVTIFKWKKGKIENKTVPNLRSR